MLISVILLLGGLFLVIKGADWFIDGAVVLARKAKIRELTIGLTVVAFGTSAPELVINSLASWNGHEDIVFGNIIGSNNFNIYIILGISALIVPVSVHSNTVKREIPLSFFGLCLLLFLVNDWIFDSDNLLSRLDSLILVIFFIAFLVYIFFNAKEEVETPQSAMNASVRVSGGRTALLVTGGLLSLGVGGRLVVDNAVAIAEALNISQKVIGLTIVAAGTSLPELATSIMSAVKGNNDIAIGNVIGSNFWNVFFILGISGLINPLEFSLSFNTDIFILLGGTILLLITMFTGKRKRLDRWEAVIMISVFVAYTIYMITSEG